MATHDPNDAQCVITRFAVYVNEQAREIDVDIHTDSLRVVCAALSDQDKQQIERRIIQDVLHADDHPIIRFRSTSVTPDPEGLQIQGTMALHDCNHRVSTLARRVNGHYEAELSINQPRTKPDVVVRIVIPV